MKKVHLICNAHIDPIWQWDWQEGVSAALSTFRSAVELADEYDYIFCHNEVTVYKFVEEYAPALFEDIKELVSCGKWRIMGGWYLQPDCNMPMGESFVRQILKGKEYFTEKFGVFPTTAINFDPFGHTKGLVQIIQKCGQDSYLFMRPYARELKLPSEQFIWKGFAGSEIKATRDETYATPLGRAAEAIVKKAAKQTEDVICVLWGVGNHGGGPSRKDLGDIEELLKCGEIEYVHSSPEAFFKEMKTQAVWDKSLHISMPGCYTSMGRVKRAHIKLENELYQAEKLCSAAALAGVMEYPTKKFGEITEDLLNAEFHDTLPGTCIAGGEANALNYLGHGMLDAERLKTKAFFALMDGQRQAAEGEYPILVFNSAPYDITENIECEFILADQNWDEEITSEIKLCDEKGEAVKYQLIKEESNLNLDWRKRIVFEANLKAFSMSRYSVTVAFKKSKKRAIKREFVFDNGRKFVEVDSKTGLLKHYIIDGVEYLNGDCHLAMFDDNADPWAMGADQLERLGTNEAAFSLEKKPKGQFGGLKSIGVVENGDIYLGIEAFFVHGYTRARVLYKIYKNNDAVDIDVTLFMNDINKIVKLKLPVKGEALVGQTAFGEDELFTDGRENVFHRYVSVKCGDKSFSVLNNCIYGGSYSNGNLYLNLVRGTTYCAHPIEDRELIPTDRYVKKTDQGQHDFSFRLIAGDASEAGRRAQAFNQRPYAVNAFPLNKRGKALGYHGIVIENGAITLEALKKADSGEGYILRLFNNSDKAQKTSLKVCGAFAELTFKGYEVKTVIYDKKALYENSRLII